MDKASTRLVNAVKWIGCFIPMALISLCLSALGILAVKEMGEIYYYEEHLGKELRQELGFRHGTPYIPEGGFLGLGIEPLVIEEITPDGAFDGAGFQRNDILMDGMTVKKFYKTLESARGRKPVTLVVVSWNDSGPIAERPRRVLSVAVPQRQ